MLIIAAGLLLSLFADSAEAVLIARVENTPLAGSQGQVCPRVVRDAAGNVEALLLNEMQLSADEFAALAHLKSLRRLTLYRTNVSDANLEQLRELPHLEGLNLTGTEVSDAAIDQLILFPSLRSLCLGNVAITPAAVARLKEAFRQQDRRLALGYAQRK